MKKLTIVEGLPCSGKSTTSKYIAKKLERVHIKLMCGFLSIILPYFRKKSAEICPYFKDF